MGHADMMQMSGSHFSYPTPMAAASQMAMPSQPVSQPWYPPQYQQQYPFPPSEQYQQQCPLPPSQYMFDAKK